MPLWRSDPIPVHGLQWLRIHTQKHHCQWDSSGRVISPSKRTLPDNTQHSQERDIHAPGRIRTHNPSRREDANPRIKPRGHWDWQFPYFSLFTIKSHLYPKHNYVKNYTRSNSAKTCSRPAQSEAISMGVTGGRAAYRTDRLYSISECSISELFNSCSATPRLTGLS